MFDSLKKFLARFYTDKPTMLMPAVPHQHTDDEMTPEQQRAAALKFQQGDDSGDDAPADDVIMPPPGPSG